MARLTFQVDESTAGERIDRALVGLLDLLGDDAPTRSRISRWIKNCHVRVDDEVISRGGVVLRLGQTVTVEVPEATGVTIEPDSTVPFSVVYEDDDIVVVDKPAGVVVHPAPGNYRGTLLHGLSAHWNGVLPTVGDALRPGVVHRLDQQTSGLLVLAKTTRALDSLQKQFQPPREIQRTYYALVAPGKSSLIRGNEGTIDAPIGRNPRNRFAMAVVEGGKDAITHWEVAELFSETVGLRVRLETGRTHQIRVHLLHAGAPVVGDPLYSTNTSSAVSVKLGMRDRQALHAIELSFLHPATGERVSFTSPLPEDLQNARARCGNCDE